MSHSLQQPHRQRILVLNPKGGSGKTTVSTNLAAYLTNQGHATALMDYDPQASSMRWLSKRPADRPKIFGVEAHKPNVNVTRSWQLRVPPETRYLVIDSPAAIAPHQLYDFTRDADAILVPVGTSDIDIHAASRFIADLLLKAKVNRRTGNIGVIANRVKTQTVAYRNLMRFVYRLAIPVIGVLRDSQSYLHAADEGLGIHEFKRHRVTKDIAQWQPLTAWLEARLSMLEARESAMTAATMEEPEVAVDSKIIAFARPAG